MVEWTFDVGKEMPRYYQALGQFIAAFALVESMLMYVTWQLSGMDIQTGQAVLSGAHIDQLSKILKRLIETKKPPPEVGEVLLDVLKHLGPINETRNEVVHYGMTFTLDGTMVTNAKLAANANRIVRRISPEILDVMSSDLHKSISMLLAVLSYDNVDEGARATAFAPHVKSPWLYSVQQYATQLSTLPR